MTECDIKTKPRNWRCESYKIKPILNCGDEGWWYIRTKQPRYDTSRLMLRMRYCTHQQKVHQSLWVYLHLCTPHLHPQAVQPIGTYCSKLGITYRQISTLHKSSYSSYHYWFPTCLFLRSSRSDSPLQDHGGSEPILRSWDRYQEW